MQVKAREVSIVEYLSSKNVRTWAASGDEVSAHCFFCGRHDRDKGRLYLNTESQVYFCMVCEAKGTFSDILRHFGDTPELIKPVADNTMWRRRILNAAVELGEEVLGSRDEVMLWLLGNDRSQKQRGLSVQTILDARLGFIGKGWSLTSNLRVPDARQHLKNTGLVYPDDVIVDGRTTHRAGDEFFRGPKVLIPYFSNGYCVQMRGKDYPDGRYYSGPGEIVHLYNADAIRGAREVVIVEGEFDCLVLQQTLAMSTEERWRDMAVVGLAGVHTAPKDLLARLKDAERVFLALDPDEAGRKASIKLADAIGPRARIVELPEDLPKCDWTEFIVYRQHTWRDCVEMFKAVGAEERTLVTFSEAMDAYINREEFGGAVRFGYSCIDATIEGGGITKGAVAVVAAKTGAGKTVLACNVVSNHIDAEHGIPTLFVSLEMPKADIAERLIKIWRFRNPYAEYDEMRAAFDPHLMVYDKNRLRPEELLRLIEEFNEAKGCLPEFIVVDHLQYYSRHQKGASAYDRATNGIMELKEVAKEADAAMMVPTQVSRIAKDGTPIESDTMRDSGAIEETADYLLTAWRPDDALAMGNQVERTGKLQASLAKNRRGPKGQRFNLLNALSSLAVVDPTDVDGSRRAARENEQFWQGKTYAQIRQQYAQGQLIAVT